MKTIVSKLLIAPLAALLLASFLIVPIADAKERGGGGGGGGGARKAASGGDRNVKVNNSKTDVRSTKVRNTSVNNVNVSKNTNVNVNIDNDRRGWDDDYHPIATAAAVTATVAVTSAVIGSMVRTLPPSCVAVNHGGVIYQQCGSSWYQPQYVGSNVQYVVIAPPY